MMPSVPPTVRPVRVRKSILEARMETSISVEIYCPARVTYSAIFGQYTSKVKITLSDLDFPIDAASFHNVCSCSDVYTTNTILTRKVVEGRIS